MKIKWVIILLVFVIGLTRAKDEKKKNKNGGSLTNREKANATITDNCLKQQKVPQKKFGKYKRSAKQCGCTQESRCLLFQNNKPVRCACLLEDYDVTEAPWGDDVTTVYNTFTDQNVLEVDETGKEKSVTIDMKIEYMWQDNRIKTTFVKNKKRMAVPRNFKNDKLPIWSPGSSSNLDYLNEQVLKSKVTFLANNPFTPNATLVHAILERRVTVLCSFDYSNYPLDTQHYQLRLGDKRTETVREILYDPENKAHSLKKYETDGFDMTIVFIGNTLEHENPNYTNTFGFDIEMKRQIQPYMFQYYLPCISIVVVSSISFVIPLSATPGRVALMVTLFLTLTNIFINQMDDSPSGSKLNALGCHLLVSLFFVMATMIEFAVILLVKRKMDVKKKDFPDNFMGLKLGTKSFKMRRKHAIKVRNDVPSEEMSHNSKCARGGGILQRGSKTKDFGFFMASDLTEKIDFAAFIAFLFGYFIYNCFYWIHYMRV